MQVCLWGWVPVLTVVFTLTMLLASEMIDQLVLRMFKGSGKWGIEILQSPLSFAVLVLLLKIVLATYNLARTSAGVAPVLYLLSHR